MISANMLRKLFIPDFIKELQIIAYAWLLSTVTEGTGGCTLSTHCMPLATH